MKNILIIALLILIDFATASAQNSLLYNGKFKHGNFETDIEIDIQQLDDKYQVKFNSLAQNAFGIPAGDIKISNDTLEFALQSDLYRYDFKCYPFGQSQMNTSLTVDGKKYDLDLKRAVQGPNDFIKNKDIRFRSQGLLLYGTIYYPESHNGKAIYLVTSSGNQDRSASRAEAILFSKAGFISFHIDKRGTGFSDGDWQLADIPQLCEDDLNALEFLHQTEKIDYKNIGIKGSSQGGSKIPYILKKQPALGFGIVVSCPASTLLESDLNYWKNRNISSIGADNIEDAADMQGSVFQYIASNMTKAELEEKIQRNKSELWFNAIWIPELDQVTIDKKLNYSPLPYFENNQSPMLIIEGANDEIIPLKSLDKIKQNIGKKASSKNKYMYLKNANHSMMFVGTSDFPYWFSLHPAYFDIVLKWIKKV